MFANWVPSSHVKHTYVSLVHLLRKITTGYPKAPTTPSSRFSTTAWLAVGATLPVVCASLWFVITRNPLYADPRLASPRRRRQLRALGGEQLWPSLLPAPRVENISLQVLGSLCSKGANIGHCSDNSASSKTTARFRKLKT